MLFSSVQSVLSMERTTMNHHMDVLSMGLLQSFVLELINDSLSIINYAQPYIDSYQRASF